MKKNKKWKPVILNNEGKKIQVDLETFKSLGEMYLDGSYLSAVVKDIKGKTHAVVIADLPKTF